MRAATFVAVACAAAMPALVIAAEPALSVRAELSPTVVTDAGEPVITVGTPLRLVIEARHAAGTIAVLPEELPLGERLGERRDARRLLRRDEGGQQVDRYELEVVPFEAGTLTVPRISLALGSTVAESPELSVEVASSLDEETSPVANSTHAEALAELERLAASNPAPRTIWVRDDRLLYGAGALVALAAAAAVIAWLVRRQRALTPPPPPPPPRPAHEVALERLAALMARPRPDAAAQKAFYVELSELLRAYVGGRYGFDSIELTLPELFGALDAEPRPGLDQAALRRILDTADLVKFAKLTTDDAEATQHGHAARQLIEATRPREVAQ